MYKKSENDHVIFNCKNSLNTYLLKVGIFGQYVLGVKVRNMKMDFNTGGTWHRVGQ